MEPWGESVPFAVDTMGPIADEARRLLDVLGTRLVERSGEKKSVFC